MNLRNFLMQTLLTATSAAAFASSNVISMPVSLSLPTTPGAIEESVVRFGADRFKSGFDLNQDIEDVTIQDPFAIKLSGVKFKSRVVGRLSRDVNGLILEAQLNDLELSIDRISIHAVVATQMSGVDARVRIDAECRNSKISWTNQALPMFARARVTTRPNLALDVSDLTLPVDLPKPDMKLSCEGPFGIENAIREQAWTALQARWTEASFASELEERVEASFTSRLVTGAEGFTLFSQSGFKLILRPGLYQVAPLASHLSAVLDIVMDRPIPIAVGRMDLPATPTGAVDRVTLTLPASSAQKLLQSWFAPGVWSEFIDAQTIDGFRNLMSSRFKQFFAFPDLMNYDKRAPFWFALNVGAKPTMRCSAKGLDLEFPFNARLMLEDAKLDIGYKQLVEFQIPVKLSAVLPEARVTKQMTAKLSSLSFAAQFDGRYVKTENPNTSIATETIADEIRSFAEEELHDLTTVDGGIGDAVKVLNSFDVRCDSNVQMLRFEL